MPSTAEEKLFANLYDKAVASGEGVQSRLHEAFAGEPADLPDPALLKRRIKTAFLQQAERLGRCLAVVDARKVATTAITAIEEGLEAQKTADWLAKSARSLRRLAGRNPDSEIYDSARTAMNAVQPTDFQTSSQAFIEQANSALDEDSAGAFLIAVQTGYQNHVGDAFAGMTTDLDAEFEQAGEHRTHPQGVVRGLRKASQAYVEYVESSQLPENWIGNLSSGQDGSGPMWKKNPALALLLLELGGPMGDMSHAAHMVLEVTASLESYGEARDVALAAFDALEPRSPDEPTTIRGRAEEIAQLNEGVQMTGLSRAD